MKKIEQHIFELLFQHDCVVLPGLGGFVASYVPAKIQSSRAFSPSKGIIFNKHLLNNDGLLAHKIIATENISYDVALSKISNYVSSIKSSLSSSKRFEIDKVGILYTDASNNICFKSASTNFLINSFGLPIVKAIPAVNTVVKEEISKKLAKVKPIQIIHEEDKLHKAEKIIPILTAQNNRRNYWWVAAAVIPLVFYSAWIPLKTDLLKGGDSFQYSDLNPFSYNKTKTSVYKKHNLSDASSTKYENVSEEAFIESLGEDVYTKYFIDDSNEYVTVQLKELENLHEVETTYVETAHIENVESNNFQKGYFVIGGCFGKESNAKNFVNDLKSKGYDAMIVDQNEGLRRVAFGKYSSRKEAKAAKKEIKNLENISAWVLKK